jgi:diguanylate cyclase (GGDEF)-like protein
MILTGNHMKSALSNALLIAAAIMPSVIIAVMGLWPDNFTTHGWRLAVLVFTTVFTATIVMQLRFSYLQHVLEQKLERISDLIRFDTLTGALTRSHFLDQVRRERTDGCLMIVDIDHFKAINDEYGHDVGDRALSMMAALLEREVGGLGMVGRLGGEEFGIFLPQIEQAEAVAMGEGLCALAQSERLNAAEPWLHPTISIGGTVREEREPIGHTLKRADRALYHAKDTGRARMVFEVPPHIMTALKKFVA